MGLNGLLKKLGLTVIKAESTAVEFAGAVLVKGVLVLAGSVALVLDPIVLREFVMYFLHVIIAVGLGQYAGRSYGSINPIALDDTLMGNSFIRSEPVAVDQQKPGLWIKLLYGQVHAFKRSFQDVDLVNLAVTQVGNGIGKSVLFNERTQLVALLFCQLLGVINKRVVKIPW